MTAYRRHLDRARQALTGFVGEIVRHLPPTLAQQAAAEPRLRQLRSECAEALLRFAPAYVAAFPVALEAALTEHSGGTCGDLDSLTVMDDQHVQEEIEVVHVGRMLADQAGPLHRLLRLEAALQADTAHTPDASPVGPAAIGRALWRASAQLGLSVAARSEAVRATARQLGPQLPGLYRALIDEVEREEGLVIGPGRAGAGASAREDTVASPDRLRFDITRPGALYGLMGEPGPRGAAPVALEPTHPQPLEGDSLRVTQLVHRHRSDWEALGTVGPSAALNALVGEIFDEILDDPDLTPEGVRWIGRLQPAVLRLAAQDAGLLQSHRHPAWRLVNRLAVLFSRTEASRPPNLGPWLEAVTAGLLADPVRARFEAASRKLDQWRDELARRQATRAEAAVGLLQQHAGLERAAEAARRRLDRRLDAARADETVRRFVSSIWALVCARDAAQPPARDSGVADAWDSAADLIWSTSPARTRADAPTLHPMMGPLVEQLRAGMDRLGLAPTLRDAWLERLAALHLKALHRAPEDACTDLPLTIDLALEDELPPPEPAAQPELLRLTPAPDGGAAAADLHEADPFDALRVGDRLHLHGRLGWLATELLWISDNRRFLLFGRPDGGTLSLTRRSLDRMRQEGLVRLTDETGILARAAQRLADRSQERGGGDSEQAAS